MNGPRKENLLEIDLNPLNWPILEGLKGQVEPTADNILNFLCTPNISHQTKDLIDRYRKISGAETERLFAIPSKSEILRKLVESLRHAKSSFMLGNYLGTIALCGLVSEFLAIFLFDISDMRLGGKAVSNNEQKKLFGNTIEKLGQERRINILRVLGEIDSETFQLFNQIREIRNKYLHRLSAGTIELETDAINVYVQTVRLFVRGIGLEIAEPGKLKMSEKILRHVLA